jgi:DNA primase
MLLSQEKVLNTLNKVLRQTPRLRKGGTEAMYYCPFCRHYKRKLEISLIEGKYHCWVCGFKGTSFHTFLMKLNAPSHCYDIIGELKQAKSKEEFDNFLNPKEEPIESIKTLPVEYTHLSENSNSIAYKHAINYIKKRKISEIDIYRYNIGFCEEGLYKNRIIIPSYNIDGSLNFFSGRAFFDTAWMKYANCDFTKNIIGFEMLIDFREELTLVEGGFDAIAVRRNCIPLFGKTLSPKLQMMLLKTRPKCVNVVLDNDAFSDSIKICEFLITNDIDTKLIQLKEKDPSILGFTNIWEYINATNLLRFDDLFKLKLNI